MRGLQIITNFIKKNETLVHIFAALIIFFIAIHISSGYSSLIITYTKQHIDFFLLFSILNIVLCFLLAKTPYPQSPLFQAIVKSILIYALLATAFSYRFSTPAIPPLADEMAMHIKIIEPLVIVLGIAGFFRPSLALIPILYFLCKFVLTQELYDFSTLLMEWPVITNLGITLMASLFLTQLLFRLPFFKKFNDDNSHHATSILTLICLFVIAEHFGHYFYSGLHKILLGEHFFSWVLENKTHYRILFGRELGILPILFNDTLVAFVYEAFERSHVMINAVVFSTQLLTLILIANRRATIVITFLYGLFHLLAFITTGISFWPLLMVNIGIIYGLHKTQNYRSKTTSIILILIVFLSNILFTKSIDAKFDTRAINKVSVYAMTHDGKEYRVPQNFFLEINNKLVQSQYAAPYSGHFREVNLMNGVIDMNNMRKANQCQLDVAVKSDLARSFSDPLQVHILLHHHHYMLSQADPNGHISPYLYAHTYLNNPQVFQSFNNLDIRDITAYKFVVESACLYYKGQQHFDKKVTLTGAYIIPVN